MILKTLTHDHGNSDVWNWYDNVESASNYYDEQIGDSVIAIRFKGCESEIVLALTDVAYLCNDEGATIEKLLPAKPKIGECDLEHISPKAF